MLQSQQDPSPLWKWLLNPKMRLHLHENRRVPGPNEQQQQHTMMNQNSTVSTTTRDASLWRWRLKMQTMLDAGAKVESAMPTTATTSSSLQGRDQFLFGIGRSPTDSASQQLSSRKPDTRFSAKTASPNLVSEVQSRTAALMSTNLAPITRAAVGASRFDMLPGSRLQLLETLQRSSPQLAQEMLEWKRCVVSMMMTLATAAKEASSSSSVQTMAVVVPQSSYCTLGSRVGQLCTLEETPDVAGASKSQQEFDKIVLRDWALMHAQGKCSSKGSAIGDHQQQQQQEVGMPFQFWFHGVLVPIAVVLAPAHATSTEELLVAHTVELLSCVRSILFPSSEASATANEAAYGQQQAEDETAAATRQEQQRPKSNKKAASATKGARLPPVIVGGSSDRPMHYHAAYEQRLRPDGFYEPPKTATAIEEQEHAAVLRRRSPPPQPLPTRTKATMGLATTVTRPATTSTGGGGSASAIIVDMSKQQRRTPKQLQELLERREQQQHQQVFQVQVDQVPPAVTTTTRIGKKSDEVAAAGRPKTPLHLVLMDFSQFPRPSSMDDDEHQQQKQQQFAHNNALPVMIASPSRSNQRPSVSMLQRTVHSPVPRELQARPLVGIPIEHVAAVASAERSRSRSPQQQQQQQHQQQELQCDADHSSLEHSQSLNRSQSLPPFFGRKKQQQQKQMQQH